MASRVPSALVQCRGPFLLRRAIVCSERANVCGGRRAPGDGGRVGWCRGDPARSWRGQLCDAARSLFERERIAAAIAVEIACRDSASSSRVGASSWANRPMLGVVRARRRAFVLVTPSLVARVRPACAVRRCTEAAGCALHFETGVGAQTRSDGQCRRSFGEARALESPDVEQVSRRRSRSVTTLGWFCRTVSWNLDIELNRLANWQVTVLHRGSSRVPQGGPVNRYVLASIARVRSACRGVTS